jgi:hypothetical protein
MDTTVADAESTNRVDKQIEQVKDGCLSCYLERMIPLADCDGFTLTERWIDAQAIPLPGLLDWIRSTGVRCDCAILSDPYQLAEPCPVRNVRVELREKQYSPF